MNTLQTAAKQFWRNIAQVGSFTLLSRVLGFVRETAIAYFVGAGAKSDALLAALSLPSFFRRVFAEGSLNASFVPIFSKILTQEGHEAAQRFFQTIFTLVFFFLMGLVIIFELFAPEICHVVMPKWTGETFAQFVYLSRISFPFIFWIALTALFGSMLNALGQFVPWAAAPAIGNTFILFFFPTACCFFPHPEKWMAIAVCLSSIAQFITVLLPTIRHGYFPKFIFQTHIDFLKRFFPSALVGCSNQLSVLVAMTISSDLPAGSFSYLKYADRLHNLPYSLIGITLTTVLLPILAKQLSASATEEVSQSRDMACRFTCFLTLPAAIILFAFAEPLVSICFERGAFSAAQVALTAAALKIYAFSLPGYVIVKLCSTFFFAHQDSKTPLIATVLSIIADAIFCYMLSRSFGYLGVALGTLIAAWVGALVLLYLVRRHMGFHLFKASFTVKVILVSLFSGFCLTQMVSFFHIHSFFPTLLASAIGAVFFFSLCFLVGLIDASWIHQWKNSQK